MPTIAEETWSAELPAGWESQRDDACVTIYHPDGVGALQISAAFKDAAVTDADLRDFAREHLDAGAKAREVAAGDFSGFTIAFGAADRFWRHWYLRSFDQTLFVTYNCEADDQGVEDEQLSQMIASLRDPRSGP